MSTTNIRTFAIGIFMFGVMAIGCARIASAQPGAPLAGTPGFTLTFDEQGNSLLNGVSNPGVPVSGGGIQYFLPVPVAPGFVLVQNPPVDSTAANPFGDTDLLTFSNQLNTAGLLVGVLTYESLIDDTDSKVDLADVPVLNYLQPVVTILETGPEGNNGFQWIALNATYNGFSDGIIPEPSTFVLGGLGLLSLAALAYRRGRLSRFFIAGLVLVAMASGSARIALAQPAPGTPLPGVIGFTLTFDEQGNSLLNGVANPNPVILMPGGGIQFFLPGPVTPGDVLIRGLSDISATNNGISDLLSFSNNTANQGILTYLSLIDDSSPLDPADVPSFNTLTPYGATEFGPEGLNSFQWVPDPLNPSGAIYNGISDGLIPEPSSLVLGGLGLGALFLLGWRRRRAA